MRYDAVLFDLDGVILSTDEFHYLAWKKLADREGIYFDRVINRRLRGVSRMESLDILLERAEREYSIVEKAELAAFKNNLFIESLSELTPDHVFDGVNELIQFLREQGIKLAIGSSSKNARLILKQAGMSDTFDAVCDGTDITRGKPDPEVFLKAAELLGVAPCNCLVIEDAEVGIDAAEAAGMDSLGVYAACNGPKNIWSAKDIRSIDRSIF